VSRPPPIMNGEQMRDFGQWLVETGRGRAPIMLDRRGLEYLKPEKHEVIGLGLPPLEEAISDHAAYLRAVF
jgi:hypothetical protein